MDNPETLGTLGTLETGKTEKQGEKTQHIKQDEQHGHHEKPGANPGTREGSTVSGFYIYPPCYS